MKTSHLGPKNLVIRLVVTDQSFGIVVQVLQACKATGGTRQAYPGFQDHDSWRNCLLYTSDAADEGLLPR